MQYFRSLSPQRLKVMRDIFGIVGFITAIWLGAVFLNNFVFQMYVVNGPSMEATLQTGDRLLVNKLPIAFAHSRGQQYLPPRGSLIVFENPLLELQKDEAFIVKRVVGLPGERVVVKEGAVTVFNTQHPSGFKPDKTFDMAPKFTDGNVDITVPDDEIFVIGDNRRGPLSFDSRNGLSTIPLRLVQGQVVSRIFPFNHVRGF